MNKKHEHKKENCGHINLKHCPKCDVVYCEDCEKEWGQCRTIVWDGSSPELDSGTTWNPLDHIVRCHFK